MANLPALYVTIYFFVMLFCVITLINCRYRGSVLNNIYNSFKPTENGYFKRILRCIVFYTPFLNKIAIAYICDIIVYDKNRTRYLLAIGTRVILFSLLFLIPSAIKYNLIVIYAVLVFTFALCIALNIHCAITLLTFAGYDQVLVALFSNVFSPITIPRILYLKTCNVQKHNDFEL